MPILLDVVRCHAVKPSVAIFITLAMFANPHFHTPASAQTAPPNAPLTGRAKLNTNVQEQANSVLAIMSYTTVPDVTTSSLSINNGATGNPGFGQTQLGGGFTISKSFPLYLEGTIAL